MKSDKRRYSKEGCYAGKYRRKYGRKYRRRRVGMLVLLPILLSAVILSVHQTGIEPMHLMQKFFAGIEKLEQLGTAGFHGGVFGGERKHTDENNLEVHFLDIGQGDATLLKCGEYAMLIDTGEVGKGTAIQYYLMKQGITQLDYLVLTHPDSDHIGSADVILTKFKVDQVLLTDYEKDNSVYGKLVEALTYQRIEPVIVRSEAVSDQESDRASDQQFQTGSSFSLGTAVCTILGPVNVYEDPNNSSIALLVEHGKNRFLFTGDAESMAEADILEYCQVNQISIQANVYKAGHHGSSTSSGDDFLDAVAPKVTVISCGVDNDYGHPHEETMKRFRDRGIQVFRTDEQGTVVAVSDGEQVMWEVEW